jgi:hypothetical protein
MSVAIIWCRNSDSIVGINGDLPWHISSDLKRFKRLTTGKSLIVGRKTYESFPNRTLPNRKLFVLTNNSEYELSDKDNHFIASKNNIESEENMFIVGGASIYDMFLCDSNCRPEYVLDFVCDKVVRPEAGDVIARVDESLTFIDKEYTLLKEYKFEDGISLNFMIRKDFTKDSFYNEIKESL